MGLCQTKFGNMCLAGHNYKNDTFFSQLSKLENGDIIKIYDINGKYVNYEVYETLKVNKNNTSCTNQDTKNTKILTLVTCDDINNNFRYVVKAKEIKQM